MDQFLHTVFTVGTFIWDLELAESFPRDPYWYLYGWIRADNGFVDPISRKQPLKLGGCFFIYTDSRDLSEELLGFSPGWVESCAQHRSLHTPEITNEPLWVHANVVDLCVRDWAAYAAQSRTHKKHSTNFECTHNLQIILR